MTHKIDTRAADFCFQRYVKLNSFFYMMASFAHYLLALFELKAAYKDTSAGKLQSWTEFSYLVLQSTSPETSTSPKNHSPQTIPNEYSSIHVKKETASGHNRFEHQKIPAGPAHLHRISGTPSQILAGSETNPHSSKQIRRGKHNRCPRAVDRADPVPRARIEP